MIIYLAHRRRGDGAVLGRRSRRSATGCALMRCRSAAGTALCFLIFASYDNRAAVCDALSPVWLSDALLGGALLYGLALALAGRLEAALALAVVAGAQLRRSTPYVAALHPAPRRRVAGSRAAVAQPCQGSAADLPPRLAHRRAGRRTADHRPDRMGRCSSGCVARDRDLLRRIIGAAAPALAATLLLLWQTRTGPAAQMLAVGRLRGARLDPRAARLEHRSPVAGSRASGAALLSSSASAPRCRSSSTSFPSPSRPRVTPRSARPTGCADRCGAMQPVALQPKGIVFTFVDLGPRLITVTHHDAIIGPYHRNGQQIADVMNAFSRRRRPGASPDHQISFELSC